MEKVHKIFLRQKENNISANNNTGLELRFWLETSKYIEFYLKKIINYSETFNQINSMFFEEMFLLTI